MLMVEVCKFIYVCGWDLFVVNEGGLLFFVEMSDGSYVFIFDSCLNQLVGVVLFLEIVQLIKDDLV